jgi:hypothetical protein
VSEVPVPVSSAQPANPKVAIANNTVDKMMFFRMFLLLTAVYFVKGSADANGVRTFEASTSGANAGKSIYWRV